MTHTLAGSLCAFCSNARRSTSRQRYCVKDNISNPVQIALQQPIVCCSLTAFQHIDYRSLCYRLDASSYAAQLPTPSATTFGSSSSPTRLHASCALGPSRSAPERVERVEMRSCSGSVCLRSARHRHLLGWGSTLRTSYCGRVQCRLWTRMRRCMLPVR